MPLWLFLRRCSSRRSALRRVLRKRQSRQHADLLPAKYAAFTESLPTRLVGKVLGNGTDPCRLAGDVDRLPGALMDWAGKSPGPGEIAADAPFASAITKAGACPQARLQTHIGAALLSFENPRLLSLTECEYRQMLVQLHFFGLHSIHVHVQSLSSLHTLIH